MQSRSYLASRLALKTDVPAGLVVRYDYLWSREHTSGRSQGKDWPACLVAASSTTPRFVVLLPKAIRRAGGAIPKTLALCVSWPQSGNLSQAIDRAQEWPF
jgi:hypothetical protein